ncbi:MAG: hypothetical protein M4579_006775 [Chaenotheca gracillima]|nr:MAG: hypothetical protein M4579_006775 [Chaenotheca gracillima]
MPSHNDRGLDNQWAENTAVSVDASALLWDEARTTSRTVAPDEHRISATALTKEIELQAEPSSCKGSPSQVTRRISATSDVSADAAMENAVIPTLSGSAGESSGETSGGYHGDFTAAVGNPRVSPLTEEFDRHARPLITAFTNMSVWCQDAMNHLGVQIDLQQIERDDRAD